MILNKEKDFYALANKYNHVPVIKEIIADCETPLSVYLKLSAGSKYSYLFESLQGGEKWGRYSFIGIDNTSIIQAWGNKVAVIEQDQTTTHQVDNPFNFIQKWLTKFRVPQEPLLPLFNGGLVGYFSYDAARYVETKLANYTKKDPLDTADILLMLANKFAILDNISGTLKLVCYANPNQKNSFAQATQYLDNLDAKLQQPLAAQEDKHQNYDGSTASNTTGSNTADAHTIHSNIEEEEYNRLVRYIQKYIINGDVMQVQLSRRLTRQFNLPPIAFYRALRYVNPSPYMYYLNLDACFIVGSSPEILIRLEDGEITIRPLAGTRKRGKDTQQDSKLAQELLNDAKEIAEHLMLIDLGRNDISRVALSGSVKVTQQMAIERYAHVMHIVSNVTAKIKHGLDALDLLQAVFPAGTLTGAPKIRAMEIIDECEPIKRGIYGGAIGYIAWNGNMDTAIAIRTAIIKDKKINIQCAAGIVADSIPAHEWQETVNKAQSLLTALEFALNNFGFNNKKL